MALVVTVPLLEPALDTMGEGTRLVSRIALWCLWAGMLLATLVPSSGSLTVLRLLAPTHTATTLVIVAAANDGGWSALVGAGMSMVCLVSAMSAELGRHHVQASAYGDERRYLLACPPQLVAVQVLTWLLWFGLALITIICLAAENVSVLQGSIGSATGLATLLLGYVLPRRFHRFSRRWLVWVPAGLVVHDHVILAETAMMARRAVAGVDFWHPDDDPQPLNLTGSSPRRGLRVTLYDTETMILAPSTDHPGGRAVHVRSFVVRPTRIRPALDEIPQRLSER